MAIYGSYYNFNCVYIHIDKIFIWQELCYIQGHSKPLWGIGQIAESIPRVLPIPWWSGAVVGVHTRLLVEEKKCTASLARDHLCGITLLEDIGLIPNLQ